MLGIHQVRSAVSRGRLHSAYGRCRGRVSGSLLAALAVAMLTSCGGSPSRSPAPAASPAAVPTSSFAIPGSAGSAAAERAAVEAAYWAFWPVLATFAREPEGRWRSLLGRVAAEPQIGLTIALSSQQKRNGIGVYGQPAPRAPKVTISSAGGATVRDCADFSRTGQADVRTGQRRTVGVARNPVVVRLSQGGDGRWRIVEVTYPGGRC
jgi:hypothetical protein